MRFSSCLVVFFSCFCLFVFVFVWFFGFAFGLCFFGSSGGVFLVFFGGRGGLVG